MTSLRGPGESNFNAVSHKPKLTGKDWIELNWIGARVGLWDTALKFLSPGPRNDVTDHLEYLFPADSNENRGNNNNNKLYLYDYNKVLQYCKSYLNLIIDSFLNSTSIGSRLYWERY